ISNHTSKARNPTLSTNTISVDGSIMTFLPVNPDLTNVLCRRTSFHGLESVRCCLRCAHRPEFPRWIAHCYVHPGSFESPTRSRCHPEFPAPSAASRGPVLLHVDREATARTPVRRASQ